MVGALNLETAVDRSRHRWKLRMRIQFFAHDGLHLLGESATHPIEPRWRTLAALFLLVGMKPTASSRLAIAPHRSPLGRVQLPFLG